MNNEFFKYIQAFILLTDLLLLNGAIYAALTLNHYITPPFDESTLLISFMFIHIGWFILSFLSGIYRRKTIVSNKNFILGTLQVTISLYLLLFMFIYLSNYHTSILISYLLFISFFTTGLFFLRVIFKSVRKKYARSTDILNRVAILGYNQTALKLADYFENDLIHSKLVGFFANHNDIVELTPYPVLSDVTNAVQSASLHHVQEIYSTISPEQDSTIYQLMHQSEKHCIKFKFVPTLDLFYNKPFHTVFFNDLPILSPFPDPLDDAGNRIKKRIFDFVFSSFVIIGVLSWLMPFLSLLIYLESKGPIIFKQKRTGKRDKPFTCLKFRTMRVNHNKEHIQASRNDARVTSVGAFLRKSSLDEFPQFLNVLLGQMSIVGPRPHMISHTAEFSQLVDHYMVRQLLKPGITGWAQVNGYRGEITHPDQLQKRISYDIWYLQNWSIWLDLKIIFFTVSGIFKGDKQAY